jgi:hypothetical protein
MNTFKSVVFAATLILAVSSMTFAKTGVISTTKVGTISTTKTGTISTTASGTGRVGTISTTRTGIISTTRTASSTNADQFSLLQILLTVLGLW